MCYDVPMSRRSWTRTKPQEQSARKKEEPAGALHNFSCAQIDLRKTRERELATLDEKSTSSEIAEP